MIKLKTKDDLNLLRIGGARLATILGRLADLAAPGITTAALDRAALELIRSFGDEPSFLNYQPSGAPRPFPAALCVSLNDEVVHGIPGDRALADGDIVSLDLGLRHAGRYTDMAITVPVGERASAEALKLIEVTKEALAAGIATARSGRTIGDIGAAIERVGRREGYGIVRDLGGHGVGFEVHEEPEVPNFGHEGMGQILEPGLVIAIEPMFNRGSGKVRFGKDGYTVRTADGSLSAHFEHTIVVTDGVPEILTKRGH